MARLVSKDVEGMVVVRVELMMVEGCWLALIDNDGDVQSRRRRRGLCSRTGGSFWTLEVWERTDGVIDSEIG